MSPNDPSEQPAAAKRLARRNLMVAGGVAVAFFGMIGAAYAAVPFYKAFCQLTGYDGTVRRAQAAPGNCESSGVFALNRRKYWRDNCPARIGSRPRSATSARTLSR